MQNKHPEPGPGPSPGPSPGTDTDTRTRPPKRRHWLTLSIGLVGFLAAGWTVAWQVTAIMTEAAIDRWMDDRRAFGERITHTGKPMLEGFPFAVRYRIEDPTWEIPNGASAVTLTGPAVTIANTPLAPMRLRVEAPKGVRATSGEMLEITGARVLADLEIGPRAIIAGSALLTDVVAIDGAGEVLATLNRMRLSAAPPAEANTGARAAESVPISTILEIGLDALVLSDRFQVPLEGPANLDARVAVEGPLALFGQSQLDPTALALWRDAGGVVNVRALSLRWGSVALSGDGTFALDPMLRPEGAATVSASGLPDVIDRVVAMGRMKRQQAAWIKLALIAGAKVPEGGGPARVTLPFAIQQGVVSLGPAKIGRVGSLVIR